VFVNCLLILSTARRKSVDDVYYTLGEVVEFDAGAPVYITGE
jgi:hypothetical protein